MARKRDKSPERISGGYAAIPWCVLDSKSFIGASDKAKSLLFALIRQLNGQNNGHLQLVYKWLSAQGWTSKSLNKKSIDELIERGLIVKTKQGGLNLGNDKYALTWLIISNFVGLEIARSEYPFRKYTLCELPPTERRKAPSKNLNHKNLAAR